MDWRRYRRRSTGSPHWCFGFLGWMYGLDGLTRGGTAFVGGRVAGGFVGGGFDKERLRFERSGGGELCGKMLGEAGRALAGRIGGAGGGLERGDVAPAVQR